MWSYSIIYITPGMLDLRNVGIPNQGQKELPVPGTSAGAVQYAAEDRDAIQVTLGRIVSGTEVNPNTGTETTVR